MVTQEAGLSSSMIGPFGDALNLADLIGPYFC